MSGFQLTIRRWQPGQEPHQDVTYNLDGDESEKLLDLLRRLQSEVDPTIPYRASCCTGKCGTCTMQVNGRPRLSCQTMLTSGSYYLEPPKGWFPVRDLVGTRARPEGAAGGT